MKKFLITLLSIFIFTFGINIVNTHASTINTGEQKNITLNSYAEETINFNISNKIKIEINMEVDTSNLFLSEDNSFLNCLSLTIEKDNYYYNDYEIDNSFNKTLKLQKGNYKLKISNNKNVPISFSLKINDISTYAKKVKINKTKYTNYAKETVQLKVTPKTKGEYLNTVTWESSNTKVATVDKNGKVTLKKKGKCTITAKVKGCKKVKCKITVKKRPEIYIKKFGFTMDYVGGVEPYFLIENNTGKKIKYIYITVYFYNRVGDAVYCDIRNINYRNLKIIGPFKNGKTKSSHFSPAIYDGTTYKIKMKSVKVEFINGETKTYKIEKTGKKIE